MDIPVTGGVPIPDVDHTGCGRGQLSYPWAKMEPGDSFFLPYGERNAWGPQVAGTKWCQRNRPQCTVVRREVDGGYRYWMTNGHDG